MDFRMTLQPPVFFRFVSVQVIQHDVHFPIRICGYDMIQEIQKLSAAPSEVVARNHLSGSNVQGRKQSGGAMPLVRLWVLTRFGE